MQAITLLVVRFSVNPVLNLENPNIELGSFAPEAVTAAAQKYTQIGAFYLLAIKVGNTLWSKKYFKTVH